MSLRIDAICPWCGALVDQIEVGSGSWHEPEAWAYLASKAHEPVCQERPGSETLVATRRLA